MEIVPRSEWAHRPPRAAPVRIPDRLPRRWLHHGAGGSSSIATARAYLNHHLDGNGWNDIGYSWLIAEGKVLEGRGVGRQGAHTRGDNASSYGICMVGNYSSSPPADRDLDALVWLLRHGHAQGWFTAPGFTGGHRDAPGASTTCPGSALWAQIGPINARAQEDDMTPDDLYDSIVPGTEESFALHQRHTLIHLRWMRTSGIPAVLEAVDAATQAAEAAASGDSETAGARAADAAEIAERVRRELAEALDG